MPLRPCLGMPGQPCSKLADGSRCPEHEQAHKRAGYARQDARRGNPTQRGLGHQHRAQVAALKRAWVAEHGALPTACPRCGRPITPTNPLTGEHSLPRAQGGTRADVLICLACNSSLGAQVRRTQGEPTPAPPRTVPHHSL